MSYPYRTCLYSVRLFKQIQRYVGESCELCLFYRFLMSVKLVVTNVSTLKSINVVATRRGE